MAQPVLLARMVLGGAHAAWWRPCCLLVASVRGLEFLCVPSAYRSQGPAMVVYLLLVVFQFVDLGAVRVLEHVLVLHLFVDLVVQGPAKV